MPNSAAEVVAVKEKVPASLLSQYVQSDILSLVEIVLDPGLSAEQGAAAVIAIQEVIADSDAPPGTTVTQTGDLVFNLETNVAMSLQMIILIVVAMVLLVLVLGLLFGYVNHRFLPVLMVGMGLVVTFGILGFAGVLIGMAAIGAFPILIGLGIDYSIQVHSRLEEEARKGPLPEAVRVTMENTGPAVLYALIATTMGFAALFISPVPMIRNFAVVAIIGIATCYAVSLVGIPVVARLVTYRPKGGATELDEPTGYGRALGGASVRIAKNPLPLLAVALLVALVGVSLDPGIPIDTDMASFVPPDMPAQVELDKVTSTMGSTSPVPIFVTGADVDSLDSMRWMLAFEDYALDNHRDYLTGATSIADLVVLANNGELPGTESELEGVLAALPASATAAYLSGHDAAQISFSSVYMEMDAQDELKTALIEDLTYTSPPAGVAAEPNGSFALWTNLIADIANFKDSMTLLGFVLVLITLLVIYRKVDAAAPLIPIVAVVGWNSVVMVAFGIDYTILTATLGAMTIGVAAESHDPGARALPRGAGEDREPLHSDRALGPADRARDRGLGARDGGRVLGPPGLELPHHRELRHHDRDRRWVQPDRRDRADARGPRRGGSRPGPARAPAGDRGHGAGRTLIPLGPNPGSWRRAASAARLTSVTTASGGSTPPASSGSSTTFKHRSGHSLSQARPAEEPNAGRDRGCCSHIVCHALLSCHRDPFGSSDPLRSESRRDHDRTEQTALSAGAPAREGSRLRSSRQETCRPYRPPREKIRRRRPGLPREVS